MTTPISTADQALYILTESALTGPSNPSFLAWVLASHDHTPESLAAAWLDFREAVRARAAIDPADYPDAAGAQQAIDSESARVDDAYRLLVSDPNGGTQ
jgi:hypothetical protein